MCDDKDFSLIQNLNAVYLIVIGKITFPNKFLKKILLFSNLMKSSLSNFIPLHFWFRFNV